MINKIIDGISIAINSEFGDTYDIYTESVEQGFQKPCFSILCLNPTINQKLGNRYFRTNQFCIHYFPSTHDKRNECMEVVERLIDALEYIKIGDDLQRGNGMHYEVIDDVLSFFVNYDMFVMKAPMNEEIAMEEVIHKSEVKG